MWQPSHGNSGLTIVQSHHTQRTCGTHLYLPSICFRFTGRLLSLCGFPLQVSRCSEGHLALNLPCLRQEFHMHRRGALRCASGHQWLAPWWAEACPGAHRPGNKPAHPGRRGSGAPRANGDRPRCQRARWAGEPSQKGARLWCPGWQRGAANPGHAAPGAQCWPHH